MPFPVRKCAILATIILVVCNNFKYIFQQHLLPKKAKKINKYSDKNIIEQDFTDNYNEIVFLLNRKIQYIQNEKLCLNIFISLISMCNISYNLRKYYVLNSAAYKRSHLKRPLILYIFKRDSHLRDFVVLQSLHMNETCMSFGMSQVFFC